MATANDRHKQSARVGCVERSKIHLVRFSAMMLRCTALHVPNIGRLVKNWPTWPTMPTPNPGNVRPFQGCVDILQSDIGELSEFAGQTATTLVTMRVAVRPCTPARVQCAI
jgi:hypothetical protein